MTAATPGYELTLDFIPADPEHPRRADQEERYILVHADGTTSSEVFPWGPEVLAGLQALQRDKVDRVAAEGLARCVKQFLVELHFGEHEMQISQALERDKDCSIRVTIKSSAPRLYALPWELIPIGSTRQALGAIPTCTIRYELPGTHTAKPASDPPPEGGRILFAWSTAGGEVPVEEHLEAIHDACDKAHLPFSVTTDIVPQATIRTLRDALARDDAPIASLHILCHGARASESDPFGLVLDAPDGGKQVIDAATIRSLFVEHAGRIRLVVLSACYANAAALDGDLGSIAQEIHRAGVPAVIASRYPLSALAAIDLVQILYHRILLGDDEDPRPRSLEEAFLEVRDQLYKRPDRLDWASLQLYARAADGPAHRPFVIRPYRGSAPFAAEHQRFFFGRSKEIDAVIAALDALAAPKTPFAPRFLFVVGPSGVGKTSLLRAGVIPALWGRPGKRWTVHLLTPSAETESDINRVLAEREGPQDPFLFVVDPMDGLLAMDREEAKKIVQALWSRAAAEAVGVSVIGVARPGLVIQRREIGLDADGLDGPAHRVDIPPMIGAALAEAITRPAELTGISLEPGLDRQIVALAAGEPGALALGEQVLDTAWQNRSGSTLTYAALDAAIGQIAHHADRLIGSELSGEEGQRAQKLLLDLVDLQDDEDLPGCHRAAVSRLRPPVAADAATFDRALQQLVNARLLVLSEDQGQETVEIAHRAYVRNWATMRGWLDKDRPRLRALTRLAGWVREHQEFPSFLLSEDQIERAKEVLASYPDDVGPEARALIERSVERAAQKAGQ